MNLNIELDEAVIIGLAKSRGWTEFVDDTQAELVGDEYPQIANPVTAIQFSQQVAQEFIKQHVLSVGYKLIVGRYESIFSSIEGAIKSGSFDQLILDGDFEKINELVRQDL